MLNIYVNMGKPFVCATCGRTIRVGQRTVTDGERNYDTCKCARTFKSEDVQT